MKKIAIHWQILIALVLAVVCGVTFKEGSLLGIPLLSIYDFLGTLFMNGLKMLIVPLVFASMGSRPWATTCSPAFSPS